MHTLQVVWTPSLCSPGGAFGVARSRRTYRRELKKTPRRKSAVRQATLARPTTRGSSARPKFRPQRVRCPLLSLIPFEGDEFEDVLWRVIQTKPFQRLRRVKQLGFSDLVYPGATHSRFAHSIGVFHTARLLMQVIKKHLGSGYEDSHARMALAASLVHDVGHGAFSHAFEEVGKRLNLKMAEHEHVSDLLIRESEISSVLKLLGSGFANDVADIIKSKGPGDIYSAVVSSQFDADRLDYMRRDRLMTGTQQSAIDLDWLIANLEVSKLPYGVDEYPIGEIETFVLGPKSISAAEQFVLGLFQLYPTVYFHKATRGAEKIFTELLYKVITLVKNDSYARTGLPKNHPIVRFALQPDQLDRVLDLDDTVVWGSLSLMAEAKDQEVAAFAERLRDRKLYKCIDVRQALTAKFKLPKHLGKACDSIKKKIAAWNGTKRTPRILVDEAVREPYKHFQESKGPLNQIRVRASRTSDATVDIVERSNVIAAIEPFRLFRTYFAPDDAEAQKFIEDLIAGEVSNGKTTRTKNRG